MAQLLLTQDRALRDGFVLHPKDREAMDATASVAAAPLPDQMREGFTGGAFINPTAMIETANANQFFFEVMVSFMRQMIGAEPEFAGCVVRWRIEERYSWRMVAQAIADKWTAPWEPPWHQLGGLAACKAVADLTKENAMQPPWN